MNNNEILEIAAKHSLTIYSDPWDIIGFTRDVEKLSAPKWLPIETAPYETKVLILFNDGEIQIGEKIAYKQTASKSLALFLGVEIKFCAYECWNDSDGRELVAPTHYMPLPEAPCDAQ